jgi:hypothetical protein
VCGVGDEEDALDGVFGEWFACGGVEELHWGRRTESDVLGLDFPSREEQKGRTRYDTAGMVERCC